MLNKLDVQVLISLRTTCIESHLLELYYVIISDAIKLLNAELVQIDANNYKTDWMAPYLKNFAKKNGVPFAALMKTLRSVMSGVKVNIASEFIFVVGCGKKYRYVSI